jgi:hypothetical protein
MFDDDNVPDHWEDSTYAEDDNVGEIVDFQLGANVEAEAETGSTSNNISADTNNRAAVSWCPGLPSV